MNFYMLVTTIIAAFLCGIIVVGAFSLCFRLMNGSKISDLGSTLLLFAISFGIVCAIVFVCLNSGNKIVNFIREVEIYELLFLILSFFVGCLFFFFAKSSAIIILVTFAVFSSVVYLTLSEFYPRKSFIEITVTNKMYSKVQIDCYKLNDYILLPIPRFWYEVSDDNFNKKELTLSHKKHFFSINYPEKVKKTINKFFFVQKQKLYVDIPHSYYYPVVYKVKIEKSFFNVTAKIQREY